MYNKNFSEKVFKKINRQVPKFFWFTKLLLQFPKTIAKHQIAYLQSQLYKTGSIKRRGATGMYALTKKINRNYQIAFKKYSLPPFDDRLYLFKSRTHRRLPSDEKTMFQFPHGQEFVSILQDALDKW
jgi:hypothetical protein